MYQLAEAIKIDNGEIFNIEFHNKRMNNARKAIFDSKDNLDLKDFIELPEMLKDRLVKCRITYNTEILTIEYLQYKKREVKNLKLVYSDEIKYDFKYKDRSQINELLKQKTDFDDILIVKNNSITDTSFSNIIFYDGKKWLTPLHPLLKGTQREKLLSENKIIEQDIKVEDLKNFKQAGLINAMINFEDKIIVNIDNIE